MPTFRQSRHRSSRTTIGVTKKQSNISENCATTSPNRPISENEPSNIAIPMPNCAKSKPASSTVKRKCSTPSEHVSRRLASPGPGKPEQMALFDILALREQCERILRVISSRHAKQVRANKFLVDADTLRDLIRHAFNDLDA